MHNMSEKQQNTAECPAKCSRSKIGGQALIEGLMMRGPEKDAIVIRGQEGLTVEVSDRKVRPMKSPLKWPLIRGAVNFFDAQVCGVKALMRSADLSSEEIEEEPSKLDEWLEKKLGDKKYQNFSSVLRWQWAWDCPFFCSSCFQC